MRECRLAGGGCANAQAFAPPRAVCGCRSIPALGATGEGDMKFFTFVIEAAVAIVTGVLTSFWLSGQYAFLVGIATLILLELFNLRYNVTCFNTTLERTAAVIKGLVNNDSFSQVRLLYGICAKSRVEPHCVRVPREDVLRFWRDCISRAEAHWFVTTYTRADETWDLGWGKESSFGVQIERLAAQCKITRVFVVDSEDERRALHETMCRQSKLGVDVRWILKDTLAKNHMVRDAWKQLETAEVAVVDGKWIYRTFFDPKRRMTGASASDDGELLKKASFVVNEAYKLGRTVPVEQ